MALVTKRGDMDVPLIQQRLRDFADEREWGQFHTPKNLAMGLSVEVGELLELFQWKTEEEAGSLSAEDKELVGKELADILIYALRLADVVDIDVPSAIEAKLAENAEKYPVELSRGNATKYSRRPHD